MLWERRGRQAQASAMRELAAACCGHAAADSGDSTHEGEAAACWGNAAADWRLQ